MKDIDYWRVVKYGEFFILVELDAAVYGPFVSSGHAYDHRDRIIQAREREDAKGT